MMRFNVSGRPELASISWARNQPADRFVDPPERIALTLVIAVCGSVSSWLTMSAEESNVTTPMRSLLGLRLRMSVTAAITERSFCPDIDPERSITMTESTERRSATSISGAVTSTITLTVSSPWSTATTVLSNASRESMCSPLWASP